MIRGYARVSTTDQRLDAQRQALEAAGVDVLYQEHASGGQWERPELQRLLTELEEGDVVVVVKLDRAARSLSDLLRLLATLKTSGAGFKSLSESIDTTTAAGRLMMQMLGGFAEFEREMIRERTRRGLEAAKQRGVTLGRPAALTDDQVELIAARIDLGEWTQADAARFFGVNRSTVLRALRRLNHQG